METASDRLAEAASIKFRWFPIAGEKTLLHLHVTFHNRLREGRIDDGRNLTDQLSG